MIYTGLGRVGEIADVKANGGAYVAEVYGGIGESNPIFYSRKELVGTSPLTFKALGQPLKDYHIFGETVQDGTPSPDYPVDVQGVGEWDATVQQYKIPIIIGNVTTPIYIGSDPLYRIGEYADEIDFANQQIIRRVKKIVLDGTEAELSVVYQASFIGPGAHLYVSGSFPEKKGFSNYFKLRNSNYNQMQDGTFTLKYETRGEYFRKDATLLSLEDWRTYLGDLYTSGNPLTLYITLLTPTTESIAIPQIMTAVGDNTLSVDTTVKPSAVSITGCIKPTGYGQLVDVNGVQILDKDSVPIYVHGQQ